MIRELLSFFSEWLVFLGPNTSQTTRIFCENAPLRETSSKSSIARGLWQRWRLAGNMWMMGRVTKRWRKQSWKLSVCNESPGPKPWEESPKMPVKRPAPHDGFSRSSAQCVVECCITESPRESGGLDRGCGLAAGESTCKSNRRPHKV